MPMSSAQIQLRERRLTAYNRMQEIADATRQRSLSSAERAEFDRLAVQLTAQDREIDGYVRSEGGPAGAGGYAETRRGFETRSGVTAAASRTVRGARNETLRPDQSMRDYAEATGLYDRRGVPTDFEWDGYWAAKLGMNKRSTPESRASVLGEDAAGPGGANIVGQVWSHDVMDLIRAKLFLAAFNVTTLPMQSELVNYPIFEADVAPMWIGENDALRLDTTPQLGVMAFNATGAFADMTAVSRN